MVRRSAKQIIKQSVNVRVHVGDTKKKGGRRRRRGGGGGGHSNTGAVSFPTPSFNPVYIQSGAPSEPDNPLLRAIHDLNENISRQHVERPSNPLLERVANVDKGHMAEKKTVSVRKPVSTQTELPSTYSFAGTNPMKTPKRLDDDGYQSESGMYTARMSHTAPRRVGIESPAPRVTDLGRNLYDNHPTPPPPQAGGGAGSSATGQGTRSNPTCSACGLRGHRKNSKQCPRHAFNRANG